MLHAAPDASMLCTRMQVFFVRTQSASMRIESGLWCWQAALGAWHRGNPTPLEQRLSRALAALELLAVLSRKVGALVHLAAPLRHLPPRLPHPRTTACGRPASDRERADKTPAASHIMLVVKQWLLMCGTLHALNA